jgi:hypothetical protein
MVNTEIDPRVPPFVIRGVNASCEAEVSRNTGKPPAQVIVRVADHIQRLL